MKKKTTILSIFLAVFMALAINVGQVKAAATGQDIVNYAKQFQGVPYVWGGTSPSGFDCSGFVQYVYRNAAGINLPRVDVDQIKAGTPVSRNDLQPGDLISPHRGHIGIYIGNGKMIHAPQTGDVVKISDIYGFYAASRIIPSFVKNGFIKQINSSSLPLLKNCEIKSGTSFYDVPDGNKNGTINYSGYKVNIYGKYGDWYLVNKINDQWIHKDSIVSMPKLSIIAKGKSITNKLLFLDNPYMNEKFTGSRGMDAEVQIYDEYSGYYLVNISKNIQWVNKNDIRISYMPQLPSASSNPIKQCVAPKGTICYSFPTGNKNNKNGVIPENRQLNVYGEYKGWYLVNKINPQWIQIK
ncbi:C40 family peptidase [Clostridium sporogenes]|nr:C40 family peptidase [Clostridium sporogenes]MCW6068656.1 C40 family peptidase [Clostridium sporogenes]